MTSLVLTIPDEPADLPGWLERQLLGPDLDQLTAELALVHGRPSNVLVLEDVLAAATPRVLAYGLESLPRRSLSLLLRNPTLLPELREKILTEGGRYWDTRLDDDLVAAGQRVASRVREAIQADASPTTPARRGLSRWFGTAATIFATAAAVLVAVYLAGGLRPPGPQPTEVASTAWGFAKIQNLPRDAGDAALSPRSLALYGRAAPRRRGRHRTA